MLCFWGMQRLFCSLIYHSRDLPILFLTKENYDSSCHRQTSHVSFLSSQVSHKLYLIIEFHELLRNGAKESGNREEHWILFLCEVRDPWKVRDSKALSLSWIVCFHTLLCSDACHTPFRPAQFSVLTLNLHLVDWALATHNRNSLDPDTDSLPRILYNLYILIQ